MTDRYLDFIRRKSAAAAATGFDVAAEDLHPAMFPHQRDVTRWALRRGRAAMFLDTGLGKTLCLLTWARAVQLREGGMVIVVAPLAVAEQIVREAADLWGIEGVRYHRTQAEAEAAGTLVVVTNYETLVTTRKSKATGEDEETWHFDREFAGIVCDESSRLKDATGKQRNMLIDFARDIPYRLCCSATPAPNDHTELGSHSEFLGIKSRVEMLAEYFVHDGGSTQDWRLKGHATQAFFAWLASWSAFVRKPSDLGYDDARYVLPPLRMHEIVVPADHDEARARGLLFADDARSLSDQRATRRATMSKRVAEAVRIASEPGQCIVWAELNDEADACEAAISGAVQVAGSDDIETKKERLLGFAEGRYRVLVSKAKIAGAGLNFQGAHRMVFVGASHSYEQTYQAIRREWRFGQTQPVDVYVIRAETESAIVENYRAKERRHMEMAEAMQAHVRDAMRAEIHGASREWRTHEATQAMKLPGWL